MKVMTEDEFEDMLACDAGYCSTCNEITTEGGVEPDAEGYECEVCENHTVSGLEQAALVGDIKVV